MHQLTTYSRCGPGRSLVCSRLFGGVGQADNPAKQSGGTTRSRWSLKPLGFANTTTLSERSVKIIIENIDGRAFYEAPGNHDGWKNS